MNYAPVITLDGPSGVGKGTLATALAHKLDWALLDSGALYRIVAWYAVQQNWQPDNAEDQHRICAAARALKIEFKVQSGHTQIFCETTEVTQAIRQDEISQAASQWAAIPEVRQALLDRQRVFREEPGLVADGRDMGTTIFPDAPLKFYVTASAEARAERRYNQLYGQNKTLSEVQENDILRQIHKSIVERDERDASRTASPMQPADDAIHINTTGETVAESFNKVCSFVREKGWLY